VKAFLAENPPEGYVLTAKSLVRRDKLEKIEKEIEEQMSQKGRVFLSEATKIAQTEGVEDATGALEALGYKVTWHGINPEKAEVFKPERKQTK
jgi:hypothetical protein